MSTFLVARAPGERPALRPRPQGGKPGPVPPAPPAAALAAARAIDKLRSDQKKRRELLAREEEGKDRPEAKEPPAAKASPTPAQRAASPGGKTGLGKGDVIKPPKKDKHTSDKKAEKAWFNKLERTSADELEPGDILLRKVYDAAHYVVDAQKLFQAELGTKYTTHAMIYVGKGQIAHANDGVKVMYSPVPDNNMLVWRATHPAPAKAATETAAWFMQHYIKYSFLHCLGTAPGSSAWGPKAKENHEKVAARKRPADEMMCSEFVTFCYQGVAGSPHIKLDATRTPPIRLEDYLNRHPDDFRFAGAIHGTKPDENAYVSGIKLMGGKALGAVKGKFESAGKGASGAIKSVSKKLKKFNPFD